MKSIGVDGWFDERIDVEVAVRIESGKKLENFFAKGVD